MPPRPPPASAEKFVPVDKPARTPNLRGIPSGYDLHRIPIHLPPHPDESVVSWLRRLSVRYDVPTRDLFRTVGAKRRIAGTSGAVTRLRSYPGMAARLGLAEDQVKPLLRTHPLAAAVAAYADTFRIAKPPNAASRYCPQCLAEPDPWWPDHWQSPLSIICSAHQTYLVNACPGCGQPPQARSDWLARPAELHRCPERLYAVDKNGRRRQGSWCDHNLTQAPSQPAPTDAVKAQRLLHSWAPDPAAETTSAGTKITQRIGFQAFLELVDAANPAGLDLFDLANDPARLGPGFAAAEDVLTQPSLDRAAAAAWMLSYDGAHAPITSAWRIANYRYSPLLAAIQLAGVRDHLAPVDQLMFRTAQPAARYPAITTHQDRRRIRLPEHRPRLPEPDPAWIPQTLWPTCIPEPLLQCPNRSLRGALLAMALAKIGSRDSWTTICRQLNLPTAHADTIDDLLRHAQRSGTWPTVHRSLEQLMDLLQRHPPPIDYRARRVLGRDTELLTNAVEAARLVHPSSLHTTTLVRQFWEKLAGGDIAYGPGAIRIDPDHDAYTAYRLLQPTRHADLFHVAYRRLLAGGHLDGPLNWTPRPTRVRR